MVRRLFLLTAALFAVPAFAQTAPAPTPAPALPRVALETSEGRVVIEVETEKAPITARNFLRYVDTKRLDGAKFYRIVPLSPTFGIVQFGVGNDLKRSYPPIKHEPTTQTGLSHTEGTISMAREAPGTARGEFTISIGNQASLDADPKDPSKPGFAAFGRVVEGLDVIKRVMNAPLAPDTGKAVAYKGQLPATPVRSSPRGGCPELFQPRPDQRRGDRSGDQHAHSSHLPPARVRCGGREIEGQAARRACQCETGGTDPCQRDRMGGRRLEREEAARDRAGEHGRPDIRHFPISGAPIKRETDDAGNDRRNDEHRDIARRPEHRTEA
jgi:peptidyl-prolyl cis-trans isomerase A (cyclophilin A)